MPEFLRVTPDLMPIPLDAAETLLVDDRDGVLLSGALAGRLLEVIGAGASLDDVLAAVGERHSPLEVHFGLARLRRGGYVERVDHGESARFWSAVERRQRTGSAEPSSRKAPPRAVRIFDLGAGGRGDALAADLRDLGVATGDAGGDAALAVVLVDDYLQDGVPALMAGLRLEGVPAVLARPGAMRPWIGPLLTAEGGACWTCLSTRLAFNHRAHGFVRRSGHGERLHAFVRSGIPVQVGAAAQHLLAVAIGVFVRTGVSSLRDVIVELDPVTLATAHHVVQRLPHCPACGSSPTLSALPVLRDRVPALRLENGARVVDPQQTLDTYGHLISPVTGVVGELRAYATGSELVHVVAGIANGGSAPRSLSELRIHRYSGSAGKGITATQARASALCEALERYSGEYRGDEAVVTATLAELGGAAIPPTMLLGYSENQYETRDEWNATHSNFAWVPQRFDAARAIDWVEAIAVGGEAPRYVPAAMAFYGAPLPADHRFASADSNGSAAGNCVEEAVLQGFLELVERDCVAMWWYNRIPRPEIDPDSIGDEFVAAMQGEYRRRGRSLRVLDITNDLGVACFAAVSAIESSGTSILQGYGAHLDRRTALVRAITELNQMLAITTGQPGASMRSTDPDNHSWFTSATLDTEPYLRPRGKVPFASVPTQGSRDLGVDVRRCAEIAAGIGSQLLYVNQTRAEIGLPVVKAIVPGLRHFWARFAPGRLYDVPVALGWIPAALREAELNPRPVCS